MSRAMNLSLAEADVVARCQKAGVAISATETLPAGGTHLVTVTTDGAALIRRKLREHLVEGRVKRSCYMHAPQAQRLEEPRSQSDRRQQLVEGSRNGRMRAGAEGLFGATKR